MGKISKPRSNLLIVIIVIVLALIILSLLFLVTPRVNYPISTNRPTITSLPPTITNLPPTITSLPPTVFITITPTPLGSIIIPTVSMTPVSLPPFPWPVPKPSALEVLTLGSLGQLAGTGVTFQDVNERITNALDFAGYDDKSYFGVPGGFAIVTRLEKMDAYGYPDYPNRWASSLSPISIAEFATWKYVEALFGAPKGRYRVFVFVVSSEPVIQSGTPVAQAEAQTWVVEGANRLPNDMKDLPYTREHTTTVYVYEFIQSGVGGDVRFNIPSNFTGRTHLRRAGLWENLNSINTPNTRTPTAPVTPVVELINIDYMGVGVGCDAAVIIRVTGAPVTGKLHIWNAYYGKNSYIYPSTTFDVGYNSIFILLGGGEPQYYLHEVWFEYNGISSNHLTNLICPGLTPVP